MDLAPLLQPISSDAPCGPNLKATFAYVEFERLTREKPAQFNGKTLITPAEEPAWRDVVKHANTLLLRSKDLRIAVALTRGLVHTAGWAGLAEGLSLVRQLLEVFWNDIHPQLDPDDEDSPTLRINVLGELAQEDTLLAPLKRQVLVSAPRAGRFSLRDISLATLPPSATAGETKASIDPGLIQAAFTEIDLEELRRTAAVVDASREQVAGIDRFIGQKLGAAQSENLAKLTRVIQDAHRILADKIALRAPAVDAENGDGSMSEAAARNGQSATGPGAPSMIRSRDDVVRALDAVCEYYRAREPSSPVPILLNRAKALVSKDFLEIIQDLVPDGMSQLRLIRGNDEGKSD